MGVEPSFAALFGGFGLDWGYHPPGGGQIGHRDTDNLIEDTLVAGPSSRLGPPEIPEPELPMKHISWVYN